MRASRHRTPSPPTARLYWILDEAQTHLPGFVMQAISRFFATEQVFTDHDLEDTRQGAGFLAVRCPTDDLKNTGSTQWVCPRFAGAGKSTRGASHPTSDI
jgi:hypothetical protein